MKERKIMFVGFVLPAYQIRYQITQVDKTLPGCCQSFKLI